MKCLIIAAGVGSRLRQRAESKPLVPLLGVPLIERVMHAAAAGGVQEFYVVSGYQGPRLRTHLDRVSARDGLSICHIVNDRWSEPNGLSVLAAADVLHEPFLLLMSDHLFDPAIVHGLMVCDLPHDGLILATDSHIDNPHVDRKDVTRVWQSGGKIRQIGKQISECNAFDTGIFYATPGLFSALRESGESHGDMSLSGGVRVLAAQERALSFDIGRRFWLDVDDSRALVKAEVALTQGLVGQGPRADPAVAGGSVNG